MKIPILPILKQFSGKWMRNLNYRVCDLYTWQSFFYLDVLRGASVGFTQGLAMLARDGGTVGWVRDIRNDSGDSFFALAAKRCKGENPHPVRAARYLQTFL